MKKSIFILFTGLLLILTGCSEEIVTVEQPLKENIKGKTISVNASMPGENTSTRMALVQDELNINLTWEEGDQIHLVFKDGDITVQDIVTIETVSNNGRRAEFTVEIPEEIILNDATSTFDLYGIYGNVSLSDTEGEESYAVLTTDPWSGTLTQVQQNEVTLTRFAETGINKVTPQISVNFQHVGSLFKILIENTGTIDFTGITGVELFSETPMFAYQNASSVEGAKYDLITGEFVSGTIFSNTIPFVYGGTLFSGDVLELWGWYSPSQNEEDIWPAINLRVNYGEDLEYITFVPKPARTATTDIGKAYHFFARVNIDLDPALAFTNIIKGSFIDERDGQQYYTVRIGNQIWMAENLRYYPGFPLPDDINLPTDGSSTDPRYYVYGYDGSGSDENLGIAAANFANYGVLYNWPAAMAGEASSSTNPSGVQGICPDGWHLPSEAEWVQLTDFVSGGVSGAGEKLKEAGDLYWNNTSVSVTNEFGFSARGGGSRQSTGYQNLRTFGHWLTSTETLGGEVRAAWMGDIAPSGGYNQGPKDFAGSIRCIKD